MVDYSKFDKIQLSDDEEDSHAHSHSHSHIHEEIDNEVDEEEEEQEEEEEEEIDEGAEEEEEEEEEEETEKIAEPTKIQYDIPVKKQNASKLLEAFHVEPSKPKPEAKSATSEAAKASSFKLRIHPNDPLKGIRPSFFTNPYTFKPKRCEKNEMEMFNYIHSWGIDPDEDIPGDPDGMLEARRRMDTDFIYGRYAKDPQYAQTPEEQFVQVLMDKKIEEIQNYRAQNESKISRSIVIDVRMHGVKPTLIRRLRVPGHLKLNTLHDRVLCPAIGFVRNYHGYVFMDQRDGGQFGPIKSDAIDMMFMYMRYSLKLDDTKYCIGDVLRNVGDELVYEYDLGDRWTFMIRLDAFPNEDGGVELLSGALGSPPEDSCGCPEKGNPGFEDLLALKNTNPSAYRKALREAETATNLSKLRTSYDPFHFDIKAARERIAESFAGKASPSHGSLQYMHHLQGNRGIEVHQSHRTKLEPKTIGVCANCGSPDDLKLCGGCSSVRYCSPQCQKAQWTIHKADCQRDKKAKK